MVGWTEVFSVSLARAHAFIHSFVRLWTDGRTDDEAGRSVKRGIWIVNRGRVEREGAWTTDGDDE